MKRVIILGGGFAAVETALRLKKYKDTIEILVIHEDDCFTFVPALYETAAGELEEAKACILVSHLLQYKGIMHYHDKILSVDIKNKRVKTTHMSSLKYDVLVFAVGAQSNYYNINGVEKYTYTLKTKEDAQKIYEYVSCRRENV